MANENNNSTSQTTFNPPPGQERSGSLAAPAGPGAKYYVALDLGSESMAACYCVIGGEENQEMIPLQHYAKELVEAGAPFYFRNGKEISERLRTRFNIRDGDQEESRQGPLEFIHAGRPSPDDYRKSIFEFFRPENSDVWKLMPNPKIVFQRGAQSAIPTVYNTSGAEKRYSPSQIIHWITVQVIKNLVLQSPQLKAVPAASIVLILTVPNVYSITHVESLRRYVATHTGVGAVYTVFESDAIAAYATNLDEEMLSKGPDAKSFYQALIKAGAEGKPLELVTFDMGRGTTDASIVILEQPAQADRMGESGSKARWRHYQKARTGRSEAGNKLTHLFVEFFEGNVEAAYNAAGAVRPYSFVQRPPSERIPTAQRMLGIQKLEVYISAIKSALSENYTFSDKDYAELLLARDQTVNELAGVAETLVRVVPGQPDPAPDPRNVELSRLLTQALTLPRELRPGVFSSLGGLFRSKDKFTAQLRTGQRKLAQELEQYVERNVDGLIEDLKAMGEAYEEDSQRTRADEKSAGLGTDNKSTACFAIIAGQGTQFKPVRAALRRALNDKLQITESRFLDGKEAKECCCLGAAAFYANLIDAMNEDHLHGTFAVRARQLPTSLQYVPVWDLRRGEWRADLPGETTYFLCFSPKRFSRQNVEDILLDDSWTNLHTFDGSSVRLSYDKDRRELSLNGNPITLQPYGIPKELYAQLWPESLPVASEEGRATAGGPGS
ncbi:MAG TPA: hypothetical protein VI636_21475 [Candidatus Angelobacter sp.]